MLKRKLLDSLGVVSLQDSALDSIDEKAINEYQLSRDLTVLELDKLEEKPTVFWCSPLKRAYADTAFAGGVSSLFRIFCSHVHRIDNLDCDLKWEDKGDDRRLMVDDHNWEHLGSEVIVEVAKVVIEASSRDGEHVPFSQPVTSLGERRIRSRWLHALKEERIARSEKIAKETTSV